MVTFGIDSSVAAGMTLGAACFFECAFFMFI